MESGVSGKQIAVISTDEILNRKIRYHCAKIPGAFSPVFLETEEKALDYLNYELPEICICNFEDPRLDVESIRRAFEEDPWIHYGGIVAVHSQEDEGGFENRLKTVNVISLIRSAGFDFSFPRMLRIVHQNRQILFQRSIQNRLLGSISGSFVIDNDPFDLKTYSHLVTNYLFNSSFINREVKEGLHVALMELLINAVEHGNCRISFDEKTKWLESGGDIFELIRVKNHDPRIAARKVYFDYRITPTRTTFAIRDEGEGFDWRNRIRRITEDNYLSLHGRGIMLAEHYVKGLTYNERGNEVRFEVEHQVDESNLRPRVFNDQKETVFEDGQTVFTQGERSDFLYYIVSGKLRIVSQGKLLGLLGPDDLFLGEMSFLLNDRRSATVESEGRSVLLKISKRDFVTAVRENPHYGIFLARLLARRLARLNQLVSSGAAVLEGI